GPAEEEPDKLPQSVEPETSRHDGITLEMTREKPQIRLHIEFRTGKPPPMFAASLRNFANSLEHQHGRQRQLRTAGKHFAAAASEQILKFKARTSILHTKRVLAAVRGSHRSIP